MAVVWSPLCMDAEEWADWRSHNARTQGSHRAERPCEDCPLGFAADMRAEGRCNGTPGGHEEERVERGERVEVDRGLMERAGAFIERRNAQIDGPKDLPVMERLRVDDATQTKADINVVMPCRSCAHEPICVIRGTLGAMFDAAVRLPKLDPAISLKLTATAECLYHLPIRKPGRPPKAA